MIKTLIFDFGDVFINLDKQGAIDNALKLFNIKTFSEDMLKINMDYEQGFITTDIFLEFYKVNFPQHTENTIIEAWNFILKDFPYHRVEWLKALKNIGNYNLILLSNTNSLHIDYIKKHVSFYNEFKSLFNAFYLSHKIGMRKPNKNIFQYVFEQHSLNPNNCLFIDDTIENTNAAKELGLNVWNIDETSEDVIDLFTIKSDLF
ncbi:HAD-IA family hydrolase [Ichthyenterobacterium sp. W332]|uniref:HAD-IA family hydrolase n=1 Tax=Microcosmobacter mediterraneus TaxID=3075607 RepID=A0ABU2YHA5_9FLAO|nr:HAD-IA family hydrolase [Ichthyenterobacterium sp. W332]MDT0557523.1 HAD-IA family hydrolase [Ichthyenterobacterium sp. W332]